MPTFSLHEAIRYLVAAVIVATYALVLTPSTDIALVREAVGGAEWLLGFIALALGTLAFNAYRQLVYNPFIRQAFDLIRHTECSWSSWLTKRVGGIVGIGPRNLLRKKLQIVCGEGWIQGIEIWAFCQIKWMKSEENSALRLWGAGVHAFYFLASASTVAAVAAVCIPEEQRLLKVSWLPILLACLGWIGGLVTDVFLEQAETLLAAEIWKKHGKCIREVWNEAKSS
jgi:hypothetical protein